MLPRFLLLNPDTLINLDLVTDVAWVRDKDGGGSPRKRLRITFAAPSPAGVGASDWSVEARTIILPDGDDARAFWAVLHGRAISPHNVDLDRL